MCRSAYATYLRDRASGSVAGTHPDDLADIKCEYGVPASLRRCHTVSLDAYVLQGHLPAPAVARLLDEGPAVDDIALPGMPAGAPVMGGERSAPLRVRGVVDGVPGGVFWVE